MGLGFSGGRGKSNLENGVRLNHVQHWSYAACVSYELSFTKSVRVADPKIYFNECCWGGDVVRDQLLPLISSKYEHIQTGQEDWGWFLWFRRGRVNFGIDIYCDEPELTAFRILLTSRRKWLPFSGLRAGKSELEELRELVYTQLTSWAGSVEVRAGPET
jgi:hypothetical protein